MTKKGGFVKKFISTLLIGCLLTMNLSGCGISSQHLEMTYDENNNEDIQDWDSADNSSVTDWDNATIVSWSDVDEYSDWVYSEIVFSDLSEDMPVVECRILDYQSNGKYFDGEKIYTLVGDKFDVNSFVAKYAVGTGVIVICVVLNVVTAGVSTPVTCFIAGAADASVSMAIKGAAFGAATKAIISAIQSGGNFEDILYGSLEGSADGYMWGAIYGAATGGFSSKYCFTEGTSVMTINGSMPIESLRPGDLIYSYDEVSKSYYYSPVEQVLENSADVIIALTVGGETIRSTQSHPYLTSEGWMEAGSIGIGDELLTSNGEYIKVEAVTIEDSEQLVPVYNLSVENTHTYIVGSNGIVVHNRCKPNEKYANDTYHFPEGTPQATKYPNGVPFDANGYPRFEQYAEKVVKFDYPTLEGRSAGTCLVGNCSSDFAMANAQAGLASTPAGYTWHHCEDMQTMLLVPQDLHSTMFGGVAHAGGESNLAALWELLEAAVQ